MRQVGLSTPKVEWCVCTIWDEASRNCPLKGKEKSCWIHRARWLGVRCLLSEIPVHYIYIYIYAVIAHLWSYSLTIWSSTKWGAYSCTCLNNWAKLLIWHGCSLAVSFSASYYAHKGLKAINYCWFFDACTTFLSLFEKFNMSTSGWGMVCFWSRTHTCSYLGLGIWTTPTHFVLNFGVQLVQVLQITWFVDV